MVQTDDSTLHDAYAADYDRQVQAYNCFIGDLLFGLAYEYIQPGETLLDAGIGSGLSALPFTKAGLQVFGMDFSPAMLQICRDKGFVTDLHQHDLQQAPWPYPSGRFDLLVCCGVMHFIPHLEVAFAEASRVLKEGALFAFTTRVAPLSTGNPAEIVQESTGGFEIFSHGRAYLETLLEEYGFTCLKLQKCFVGEDVFSLWLVRSASIQTKLSLP